MGRSFFPLSKFCNLLLGGLGVTMWRQNNDLDDKLWKIFSQYIRKRSCPDGWGRCYTCLTVKDISELDAGHYISRSYKPTKYDERNVRIQCRQCNRFKNGDPITFREQLVKEMGEQAVTKMELSRWTPLILDDLWYQEMIKDYKGKLKAL